MNIRLNQNYKQMINKDNNNILYHYVHQDLIHIFIFPNEDLIYQIWGFNKQKNIQITRPYQLCP